MEGTCHPLCPLAWGSSFASQSTLGIQDTHIATSPLGLLQSPHLQPPGPAGPAGPASAGRALCGRGRLKEPLRDWPRLSNRATPWSTRRAIRAGVTEKSNVWTSSRPAATLRLPKSLHYQAAGWAPLRLFGVTGSPEDERAAAKQEPPCLSSDRLPSKWDAIPSTTEPSRFPGSCGGKAWNYAVLRGRPPQKLLSQFARFTELWSWGQAETQVEDPSCCETLPTLLHSPRSPAGLVEDQLSWFPTYHRPTAIRRWSAHAFGVNARTRRKLFLRNNDKINSPKTGICVDYSFLQPSGLEYSLAFFHSFTFTWFSTITSLRQAPFFLFIWACNLLSFGFQLVEFS